jgi:hypothetical protein
MDTNTFVSPHLIFDPTIYLAAPEDVRTVVTEPDHAGDTFEMMVMPFRCSECDVVLYDITPATYITIHCDGCGARWTDLGDATAQNLSGMDANAWEPNRAPELYTQHLGSMSGGNR